jgi:hypothetical protein
MDGKLSDHADMGSSPSRLRVTMLDPHGGKTAAGRPAQCKPSASKVPDSKGEISTGRRGDWHFLLAQRRARNVQWGYALGPFCRHNHI